MDVASHPEFASLATLDVALHNAALAIIAANPVILYVDADEWDDLPDADLTNLSWSLVERLRGLRSTLRTYRRKVAAPRPGDDSIPF